MSIHAKTILPLYLSQLTTDSTCMHVKLKVTCTSGFQAVNLVIQILHVLNLATLFFVTFPFKC